MTLIFPPLQLGSWQWNWDRTCVFGVVNVTPDSFFDGGRYFAVEKAVAHGCSLVDAGAHVLDIGGESTRPNAAPVDLDEELRRVIPVIRELKQRVKVPLSIDTYKAEVAQAAIEAGATIVNDISGMKLDSQMARIVAATESLVILGHLRGHPRTMQHEIHFENVVEDVGAELRACVRIAVHAGIKAERIWIDPGIGFGKTAAHSVTLLKHANELKSLVGYPVLLGPSRKSFIGAITGESVEQRLMGTCSAVSSTIALGADAVRIHDVRELMPAIRVADAIRYGMV